MADITEPPFTRLEGFDRNGIYVGSATLDVRTGKWDIIVRGEKYSIIAKSEAAARGTLREHGAWAFRECQ